MKLCGIWGRPYVDLSPVIDTSTFPALHDEITLGLARLEATDVVAPTGGGLKTMNVVAPWVHDDGYVDYGHAIARLSRDDFARFVSLADDPSAFDVDRREEYAFGDETDHPLSRAQAAWLAYRCGVYFPWKVCFHFVENERWDDKHSGAGKSFTPAAREHFPRTVAFIERLPFREIGRAVLFGLNANDHAPMHRDSEPGKALSIAESVSFHPARGKRFVLSDPLRETRVVVDAPVYWFNDMDYHGVEPDPFFRYSIRVDGVFDRDFLRALERRLR